MPVVAPTPAIVRLFARGAVDRSTGCILWTGSTVAGKGRYRRLSGYGYIRDDARSAGGSGRLILVHRLAWRECVGGLAPDLTLDHLCRRRACFCPGHLEPVAARENARRIGDDVPGAGCLRLRAEAWALVAGPRAFPGGAWSAFWAGLGAPDPDALPWGGAA